MRQFSLGINVFEAGVSRLRAVYRDGHRVVISMSGGKDSTVCLELALIAARLENRLPVEVVMLDQEIMPPETWDYLLEVATRPDVDFTWLQTVGHSYNPYDLKTAIWWPFDQNAIRMPPDIAVLHAEASPDDIHHFSQMSNTTRFPPPPGKRTYSVQGLRAAESLNRRRGIYSSKGYLTSGTYSGTGVYGCRPIYDWTDADVWRAIKLNGWTYNRTYDVLAGEVPIRDMRIAPPGTAFRSYLQLDVYRRYYTIRPGSNRWPNGCLGQSRLQSTVLDRLLLPKQQTIGSECFVSA